MIRYLAFCLSLIVSIHANGQTLDLSGTATATFPSASAVVLSVGRVSYTCPAGQTGHSGTLRLELWATASPYSGGSVTGYRTATYTLGVLDCNFSFNNISSGTIAFTQPPIGYSNYSLMLTQYVGPNQYPIVDFIAFPSNGNTNANLVDLQCSQNVVTLKFWDSQDQDSDYSTVTLGNETLVSNFNMNQCGGPSEPISGPCVFTRTLPPNSAVAFRVFANSAGTGGVNINSAALKVIGQCTPERQDWELAAGQTGQITINTGSGGGTPTTNRLTVQREGAGTGTVSGPGISCGTDCAEDISSAQTVSLTATPSSGSSFAGWTGCTTTSGTSCTVNMSTARTVTASFSIAGSSTWPLTVTKAGSGSGTVSSSPAGLNCGSTCSANFNTGASVTLTAAASVGSIFAGWSGDCSGAQSTCTVSMGQARGVSAAFNTSTPGGGATALQSGVSVSGSTNSSTRYGDFREYVVTIPSGTTQFAVGTTNHSGDVDLFLRHMSAPTPTTYDCVSENTGVTPDTCTVSSPASGAWYIRVYGYQTGSLTYSITASWSPGAPSNQSLVVSRAGSGTGSVSSSPAGISCGSSCSTNFATGSAVVLTAAAGSGAVFAGWGGDCSGSQATCTIAMSQARNVTATFNAASPPTTLSLGVTKTGNGAGSVVSIPAGVNCGSTCAGNFNANVSVSLTATAASGSTFVGWSQDCTGSASTCMVNMSQARNVTASFVTGSPPSVSGASLAAGESHSCALGSGGSVWCWGRNDYGQLGVGGTTDRGAPVQVPNLSNAIAVAAGRAHTCALMADGTAKCWGRNRYGQLGNGSTTDSVTPVTVVGLTGATALALGPFHGCAIVAGGVVRCWGYNGEYRLGSEGLNFSATPIAVTGLTGATALALGGGHGCAIVAGGVVRCWGRNLEGQLGDGSGGSVGVSWTGTPVTVANLTGATVLALGAEHTCAIVAGGAVRCWGRNTDGQLGDNGGTLPNGMSPTPVAVIGLSGATALNLGGAHSCAVVASGAVHCWGGNYVGQLGNGSLTPSATPVTVTGLSGATSLALGGNHSCAIMPGGAIRCWGYNGYGQVGRGSATGLSTTPVMVTGLTGATAVASGFMHSCAIVAGGAVECWGDNSATPVMVTGLIGVTALAVGDYHSCVIVAGGAVRCWGGSNEYGALGNGTTSNSASPVTVTGLTGATALALGRRHSCAIVAGGAVRCWGRNFDGELGNGSTATHSTTPVTVTGLTGATALALGGYHSCAIVAGGAVRCWGWNVSGQLGNGSTISGTTPVTVTGLTGATALALGHISSCAIATGGTVRCWGDNTYGSLGNGSTNQSATPVVVTGLSGVTVLASAGLHSCAILAGSAVQCWGLNDSGQLGDGSTTTNTMPVTVSGLRGAHALELGYSHSCAIVAGGDVRCWGTNGYGQLGDGSGDGIFTVPQNVVGLNEINHSAIYYAPANAGYGLAVTHQDDTVAAIWYTYSSIGRLIWFSAAATRQSDGRYRGPFYASTGTPMANIANVPAAITTTAQGQVELSFDASGGLDFAFTPNAGATQHRLLERLPLSTTPLLCRFTDAPRSSATNYSDLWWNSSESGWGASILHQGNLIFLAWYTYGNDQQPQWLTAVLQRQSDGGFTGRLNRPSTGTPYTVSPSGNVTSFPVPEVGDVRLSFSNGEAGTLRYTVDGVTQSKAIQRLVFGTRVQVCQ